MIRDTPELVEARALFMDDLRTSRRGGPNIRQLTRRFPHLKREFEQLLVGFESSLRVSRLVRESLPVDSRWYAWQLFRPASESVAAISRLLVLREIGRGGMGAVNEVWDPELGRVLACKVQLDRSDPDNPIRQLMFERRRARILTEARVMARLDHPGVVAVHELGVDADGRACFTMTRVEGREYSRVIEEVHGSGDRRRLREAVVSLLSVAETVSHAHSCGILHRDLKPNNIMVEAQGRTYLMDWGVALVREDRRPGHARVVPDPEPVSREPLFTRDGDVLGTPAYMAPEQAAGARASAGMDVYGLGGVLYHLLSGHAPYQDRFPDGANAGDILDALAAGPPTPLTPGSLGDASLRSICHRALHQDPCTRYGTAAEFAAELRAYLEYRTIAALRTDLFSRGRNWWRRNSRRVVAVALPVLMVIATAIPLLNGARDERDRARGLARIAEREREIANNQVNDAQGRLTILEDLGLDRELNTLERRASELWPVATAPLDSIRSWEASARRLAARLPDLERRLGAWDERHGDPLQRRTLERLSERLRRFVEGPVLLPDSLGVLGDSMPEVVRRVRLAERITDELSMDTRSRSIWAEVIADLAEPGGNYAGFSLVPRSGLVALGADPESGLWEFWHVASGARPERSGDPSSAWVMGPDTGLVLTLIPGGVACIGTTADPRARLEERPQVEMNIDPFYLSKYEMTQAQWRRLAGAAPSRWTESSVGAATDRHPVESVEWRRANDLLRCFDLCLPTEVQWEYAARGGAGGSWGGMPAEYLAEAANLVDQSRRVLDPTAADLVPWNDGFTVTAPVGSFVAGPFGLHDMSGNVREWCADGFHLLGALPFGVGTGLRDTISINGRVARGSSYRDGVPDARVTRRMGWQEDHRSSSLGLRPAMSIRPEAQRVIHTDD